MKRSTEIEKTSTNLPAVINMEEQALDMQAEHITTKDLPRPVLTLLQSGSPQCKRAEPKFIEGAREGQICLTTSQELFDAVEIVPVKYVKKEIEWKRGRKGFVAEHSIDSPFVDPRNIKEEIISNEGREKRLRITKNDTVLVETAMWYCLLLLPMGIEPVIITMTSSQLTPSRDWLGYMCALKDPYTHPAKGTYPPAYYSRSYTLKGVSKSDDDYSWMIWDISLMRKFDLTNQNDINIIQTAMSFKKLVEAGNVIADHVDESSDNQTLF